MGATGAGSTTRQWRPERSDLPWTLGVVKVGCFGRVLQSPLKVVEDILMVGALVLDKGFLTFQASVEALVSAGLLRVMVLIVTWPLRDGCSVLQDHSLGCCPIVFPHQLLVVGWRYYCPLFWG